MNKDIKRVPFLFLMLTILQFSQNNACAQSNNPAPYCMPIFSISPCNQPSASNNATNTVNHFINDVVTTGATTNIINTNSGCNGLSNNYIYYCQPFMIAAPGQVITCSVQSGINFDQSFALFVDWDQNGNFDLPAEQLDGSTSAPTAASWFVMTFTVPAQQANGTYRLRIRSYYTAPSVYVDPCDLASVGETEDYNLFIGGAGSGILSGNATANSPLCAGQTMNLLVNHTGSSGASYQWSGPAGFTSSSQSPVISAVTPTMTGLYTVIVTDGPCTIARSVNVQVNLNPTITVNNSTVCSGNQAVLVASGANSYTWSSGQNTSSISVTPVNTSTFLVSGSTNSCLASQSSTVTVFPIITLSLTSTSTLICAGSQVTLNVSGANSYTWNNGFTGSSIVISPTISTSYSVTGESGPCISGFTHNQLVENCNALTERNFSKVNLKVYPNPFKEYVNVVLNGSGKIVIFNVLGEQVFTQLISNSEKILLKDLPSGVYYLSVSGLSEGEVIKIIKN